MYNIKHFDYEQRNIALKSLEKPSMDFNIHWLNPLWQNCVE